MGLEYPRNFGTGRGFGLSSDGKDSACSAGGQGSVPDWEDALKEAWKPTPVLLPGESPEQRGQAGYSPRGRKELDMTE